MSKIIRQLLGEKDPRFALSLAKLESSAGLPGVDARLTADIRSLTHAKISSLGLDPLDTTGQELYAALLHKLWVSEEHLKSYLGHPASVDDASYKITQTIEQIIGRRETWAIKQSVLRKIFTTNPPKKVMKAFHFKSADSLVKRMDPSEIVMAARVVESKTWWQKTKKLITELSTKDFEKTYLKIITLNDSKWLELLSTNDVGKGHSTIHAKECAAVGVVAVLDAKVPFISSLLSALYAANEVLLHGVFLKLHYVNPSIGLILTHAIDEGQMIHTSISDIQYHWRDVQRHFGLKVAEFERYYSHLDVNDLGWIDSETKLSLLIPEMAFWVGMDFCGVVYGDEKIISCNILDLIESANLKLDFNNMCLRNVRRSLRSELLARYLVEPSIRAVVLKQFDISGLIDEDW